MRTNSLAALTAVLVLMSASAGTQLPPEESAVDRALRLLEPPALLNPTEVAVAAAEAGTRARPRDPDAWNQLGRSLDVAGRLTESADAHERATRLPPRVIGRAFLYRDLAEMRERTGDLPRALAAARLSVRSWPLSRVALHCADGEVQLLARLLVKSGDIDGALAFYGPLYRANPDLEQCRDIRDALEAAQGAA